MRKGSEGNKHTLGAIIGREDSREATILRYSFQIDAEPSVMTD